MRQFAFLLLLAAAPSLVADDFRCATSEETNARVEALGAWSRGRAAQLRDRVTGHADPVQRRGDLLVIPADPANAPGLRTVDLAGKSVTLRRVDASRFDISVGPLDYDTDRGVSVRTNWTGNSAQELVTLTGFRFPFFDGELDRLHVSRDFAIYDGAARRPTVTQMTYLAALVTRQAVIAPLLTTPELLPFHPQLFVKQGADSVTLTWFRNNGFDIQATLFANGDIRFSYRTLTDLLAGAMLVTSGREAWRNERETIATAEDPSQDLSAITRTNVHGGAVDVERVTLTRIAGLGLLEVRVKMREAWSPISLRNDRTLLQFQFQQAGRSATPGVGFDMGQLQWTSPRGEFELDSPAVWLDGNDVVFYMLQEDLAAVPNPDRVIMVTFIGAKSGDRIVQRADTAVLEPLNLGVPRATRDHDLSAAESLRTDGPVLEAFTLPVVSPDQVWEQVKASTGLRDDEVDGVAIYQNFLTDLVLYASAYSTVGNPGVTGISSRSSPDRPLRPALMHMNKVDFGPNRQIRDAEHTLLHELGHRWLLFAQVMENGTKTYALNPLGSHPAQYADTRSAFRVYEANESSVMGGGFFTDNGNSTFTSGKRHYYGYSFLDLYLMGLAPPDEVPSYFYIANSNPPLAQSYYPPENQTYSGTRRDVAMSQLLEAMGPRKPAYPDTQRKFRVVFVLLSDPNAPATDAELALVDGYRREMEAAFVLATGGRGQVATSLPNPPGKKRRAVGR